MHQVPYVDVCHCAEHDKGDGKKGQNGENKECKHLSVA